ncbi:hypothetical protein LAZ67_7001761 [Cordylochernes scorpioides]|uniref:Mos1 transposase HTH domain-containing protein n=1 Tax=Cordylochernes scorpioides TaxID=51811 RepID=A0ABY6KQS8_9ARAC|nr:hypothetical protein LAZ67_7001761 [Cordylochernes scorpioides]
MGQRTCIKFCVKNEIKCADAFRMLTVAYGDATLDRSNVYRWYKMLSEGQEDVNDEERAGRSSTSTTDEKINEVEKMILANRRIAVREVAEDLNISIGSCHSIFINDLGMRRVAAKFVPKLLNCDQKQHRMNIANEMLDSVRDDPNLLQRVITGDEAVERSIRNITCKLCAICAKQNARNARICGRKNWLLHHDNAPAHTSLLVRDLLAKNNTLMMPQPPYSPDLAPCDFFLFPKLKRPMKGRRYATLDEIKTASKEELKKIFKNDFLKCFEDWKNRWNKCIISHGDYFEGDKIGYGYVQADMARYNKYLIQPVHTAKRKSNLWAGFVLKVNEFTGQRSIPKFNHEYHEIPGRRRRSYDPVSIPELGTFFSDKKNKTVQWPPILAKVQSHQRVQWHELSKELGFRLYEQLASAHEELQTVRADNENLRVHIQNDLYPAMLHLIAAVAPRARRQLPTVEIWEDDLSDSDYSQSISKECQAAPTTEDACTVAAEHVGLQDQMTPVDSCIDLLEE